MVKLLYAIYVNENSNLQLTSTKSLIKLIVDKRDNVGHDCAQLIFQS